MRCVVPLLFLVPILLLAACSKDATERKDDRVRSGQKEDLTGITEIALQRTVCLGMCPDYKVILRSDGTATWIGEVYVIRKGNWKGEVSKIEFEKLAKLINRLGFFAMKERYPEDTEYMDAPNAEVSVVRNGSRKAVYDNALEGPVELWGMEIAIDSVAEKIEWKREKKK